MVRMPQEPKWAKKKIYQKNFDSIRQILILSAKKNLKLFRQKQTLQ
jgi:hypothetical protein